MSYVVDRRYGIRAGRFLYPDPSPAEFDATLNPMRALFDLRNVEDESNTGDEQAHVCQQLSRDVHVA